MFAASPFWEPLLVRKLVNLIEKTTTKSSSTGRVDSVVYFSRVARVLNKSHIFKSNMCVILTNISFVANMKHKVLPGDLARPELLERIGALDGTATLG